MCGIFAVLYCKNIDTEKLIQHAKKMHHRGTEGFSYKAGKHFFISHNRHIVIDTSDQGAQPFTQNAVTWAMNSEIYNHENLAQSALSDNKIQDLPTHSDSKSVGLLYQRFAQKKSAKEICNSLDGKFAFVLYDEENEYCMIGRDPIGLCPLYYGHSDDGALYFASELKAIENLCPNYRIFPPGHVFTSTRGLEQYYTPAWLTSVPQAQTYEQVLPKIKEALERAVQKRLMSDVPVAFLLSGGLDSSLVCSIVRRLCPERELHTFSIGIKGAPDLVAAQEVANQIGSIHHEYHFTVEEAIAAVDNTIYHIESFEQVRASVPMMILMKKIREQGFKVILSGEGSDEIFGGYLYFFHAPNKDEMHHELVRKTTRLHKWDVLRANKVGFGGNIEVRCPYLDKDVLDVVMNMDPALKMPSLNEKPDDIHLKMEKYVLRKAFDCPENPYLPDSVLWRQKEAFSDGVGYNWVLGLQKKANEEVTEQMWRQRYLKFPINTPRNKEYYYLRSIFQKHFPSQSAIDTVPVGLSIACSTEEAVQWNPEWKDVHDISGRALGIHISYN